ncbi:hypothetical protein HPB50_008424 [Hyalomma asiaticum]|uniref:Uncharacterized protein n=1 Tax=Hyalomma asiaticum TaxID=266040 RepID=A0ACB7RYJ2_HYAAI|nr:hypothetical protein HPB50_008424 [Hyalomma asiaticum]
MAGGANTASLTLGLAHAPPPVLHWAWLQGARLRPRAYPTSNIVRTLEHVSTWTIRFGERSVRLVSHLPTEEQPEEPGCLPTQEVADPFRALTLQDRHPSEPTTEYTVKERRCLCTLCGVPEIHHRTHIDRSLHAAGHRRPCASASALARSHIRSSGRASLHPRSPAGPSNTPTTTTRRDNTGH